MAEEDKFADEKLKDEQLDGVAGGTFWPNKLHRKTYEAAGIKVVDNFFYKDEFWYKGENIGHDKATAVALFYENNKTHPSSIEEALKWEKEFDKKRRENMRSGHISR